jgi:hypothetical protein
MNPAAKQFDIIMGVDIHLVQPPGPVPPIPIPHPFFGIVFDPMAFIPGLGSSILVNGVPLAQAGTAAQDIPVHVPLGGTFLTPPANEGSCLWAAPPSSPKESLSPTRVTRRFPAMPWAMSAR